MKNIYPALIVGCVLHLTTLPNQKLHIVIFCELLHLVPTFLLPLYNNFQFSLPSFLKLLPNLHKAITAHPLVLKSSMVFHALDSSYYTLAETAATNKAIADTILEFVAKATDNKNKHLRHLAIRLIDNLEPLQLLYFTEHNLMSIVLVVRFPEQVCTMDEQFNSLSPTGQV